MAFSINQFIQETQKGLARDAHFEMLFSLPSIVSGNVRQMSILCNSANVPERAAEVVQVRRSGHGLLSPYVTSTAFAPFSVTFYCDADGETIKTMLSWVDSMMDFKNVGNFNMVQYKANYTSDITLNQYNSDGSGVASYKFAGAFPSSVGPVNFSWASRDNLVLIPATFTYTTFRIGDAPPKALPNISTTPQPGKNNRLPVTGNTPN